MASRPDLSPMSASAPTQLKSAANALIAIGFFYVLIIVMIFTMASRPPDTFGYIFGSAMLGFGLLLWFAAFLLYRCNRAGRIIWYICSPFVLLQFPIGTILGVMVYVHLGKEESREALASRKTSLPAQPATD